MTKIATTVRRVNPETGGTVDMTIGELILIAAKRETHILVKEHDARRELGRLGVRLPDNDKSHFTIANRSPMLERLLDGTPWSSNWKATLRNFDCASPAPPQYYSAGLLERGTHLRLDLLTLNVDEEEKAA